MTEINRVLRRAGALLLVSNLVRWFVLMLAVALGAAIVAVIVTAVFGVVVDWWQVAMWAGIGVVATAVIGALVTRPRPLTVARRVDEGADLRESLSTALSVAGDPSPWSKATVDSAAERARGVRVVQAVPVRAPRFWPVPIALAFALVIVAIVFPRDIDVLGWQAQRDQEAQEQAEIIEAQATIDEAIESVQDIVDAAPIELDLEFEATEADASEQKPKTREEMILKALSDVTEMKDRLEQIRSGEDGAKLDALRDQLAKLRSPADGPLQEMSRELSKGNFSKAADALQELRDQMNSGEMTAEQKEQLQKQLDRLAEQLDKLANDRKDLERKLEQAGLNKDLASDPEALKEALKNANLSEQQKQQLQQQADSQQGACKACNSMSQGMQSMSQSMSQGDMGQMSDSFSEMMGQLSELEMLESQMSAIDKAASQCEMSAAELSELFSECEGGSCQGMGMMAGMNPSNGPYKPGDPTNSPGAGSGGPGQGNGNSTEAEAAFAQTNEKSNVNTQAGPTIGSRLTEGEQVKGESREEFKAAVAVAREKAAEAMETNVYPKEYHETIKRYLGNLQQRGEDGSDADSDSDDTENTDD